MSENEKQFRQNEFDAEEDDDMISDVVYDDDAFQKGNEEMKIAFSDEKGIENWESLPKKKNLLSPLFASFLQHKFL